MTFPNCGAIARRAALSHGAAPHRDDMLNRTIEAARETGFWHAYNGRRYAILFYALLLTLIAVPLATGLNLPATILKLLLGACLFAAVMPNSTRRSRWFLLTGTVLLVWAEIASEHGSIPVNPALLQALVGVAGLVAAAGALRYTITAASVNGETIFAALSTYLLAGIFFGRIYWAIQEYWPGSIVGPDPLTGQIAIYYSFVTLATLGYGDFLPRTDIARGVATFEVIGGQLFLAVMVARLLSAFDGPDKDD
ncbi:MAG: potassium channel family protein [Sphingomicrobium sp.]